jgi:polyisoprenoid-binding protein YceI
MGNYKRGFYFRLITAAGMSCVLAAAVSLRAEDVKYRARAVGNKVLIEGTSNIHDWTMDGQIIGGYLELPDGVVLDSNQGAVAGASGGKVNAKVDVFIPVTSIKNSEHEGMSETMQDAMKAAEFPRIEYRMTEMTLKEPHAAGTPLEFDTKGELAVAGVTNQISMPVKIETVDATKLKITGSIPLKMTDFKIKPPVKAGIFRTYDPIKISFVWIVGKPVVKTQ